MQPNVSIILLNYKGTEDTIACIDSLQSISYSNYNIIIIDNASPDDSMERLEHYLQTQDIDKYSVFSSPDEAMQSRLPNTKFTLLQSGHNGGYGHGNNLGIKYALKNGTDYVLTLNNDTIVESGFLQPMVQMCEKEKNIGIVSGQIFYLDQPDTFWFNGGTFNKYTGKIIHNDYNTKNTGQKPLHENTFITGCMWLIPKNVFHNIGFINEEYFMYVEDLEFSQRVLERGYSLKISQDSHIYHKVGSSSGGEVSEFPVYWTTKNKLKFMHKNMKPFVWPLGFYNIFKYSIRWLLQGNLKLIKSQLKALTDFFIEKINSNHNFL